MHHLTDIELIEMASGQLAPDRQTAAGEHLAGCPRCRARSEESEAVWRRLGLWQAQAGKTDHREAVVRAAATGPACVIRRLGLWPAVWPLARVAAVVVLAGAIGFASGWWTRPPPATAAPRTYEEVDDQALSRALYLDALGSTPLGLADSPLADPRQTEEVLQ